MRVLYRLGIWWLPPFFTCNRPHPPAPLLGFEIRKFACLIILQTPSFLKNPPPIDILVNKSRANILPLKYVPTMTGLAVMVPHAPPHICQGGQVWSSRG